MKQGEGGAESPKDFGIQFAVEPNHQRLSLFQCRCAQIPGWTQHQFHQLIIVGAVCLQVDVNNLFALGNIDLVNTFQQGERIIPTNRVLPGVDDNRRLNSI
jgi:hypothetical protein